MKILTLLSLLFLTSCSSSFPSKEEKDELSKLNPELAVEMVRVQPWKTAAEGLWFAGFALLMYGFNKKDAK